MRRSLPLWPLAAAMLWITPGCKVPLSDINAAFIIADAAWFAEEETLFVFYEMGAEQGLGPDSQLEVRYTTDDGVVSWTALTSLDFVHLHVPVDCGVRQRCGSASVHVPRAPRDVGLRLRYHREGELSLEAETVLNIVGPGPPHTHRSLLVYGVFDEANRAVQWRARHRFPTIRNEEAQRLGLRRRFTIETQRVGEADFGDPANPYAYGVSCPSPFSPFTPFSSLEYDPVETEARAIFNPEDLPDDAAAANSVCAQATVYGPLGPFSAGAVARKNPEVRPAFPLLRSPIRDALPIKYLLSVCDRTISDDHLEMQQQRLLMSNATPICLDGPLDARFADELSARLRDDIETTRAQGRDMVLVLALHHDSVDLGDLVEGVLDAVLGPERMRTTPRVAGAFVLDSFTYTVSKEQASQTVIWCPAPIPVDLPDILGGDRDAGVDEPDDEDGKDGGLGENLNLASLACAILPDNPDLTLGPFSFGALPVFPSRELYLDFVNTYSTAEAGTMKSLSFRVPELPPTAEHVFAGPFGVATFLNGEVITAEPDDAFSFCETEEYQGFVFRSPLLMEPLPIAALPELHSNLPTDTYPLGIFWDFPYLLRLRFESIAAGSISAFSASLPFGIATDTEQDFGSAVWLEEEFPLAETLTQCDRFCDHPTFDAAGVYQVTDDFRNAYAAACYTPKFPRRGDSGFPSDP